MNEPGDKLSRAYRDLAREEPPSALDASILAASARALRRPSASRRWAVPVSIAAVFVLALGLTLEMQREQPGIETSAPAAGSIPPRAVAPQPAPLPQAEAPVTQSVPEAPRSQERARPSPKPQLSKPRDKLEAVAPQRKDTAIREEAAPAPAVAAPQAASPAPQAFPTQVNVAPLPAAAGAVGSMQAPPATAADMQRPSAESQSLKRMAPAAPAAAKVRTADDRELQLERIAQLRVQGRNAEADKALEEFRRANPDYRIPEAMWERVKPR